MRKKILVLIGVLAGLAVGAGGALAAQSGGGVTKPPDRIAVGHAGAEAIGGGSASSARMAALINGSQFAPGPPPNFGVVRSVGVQSVSNPQAGLFCVRPDPGVIPPSQISKLIPTVAATFVGSAQFQVWAQYVSPRPGPCQVGTIGVRTFSADESGNLDNDDNDVAFTIVVD